MNTPKANFQVPVDLTNPGQFFACCGLLELADRLWPGAEGWFRGGQFNLNCAGNLRTLLACMILDPAEQRSFACKTVPVKPIIAPLTITLDGDANCRLALDFWTKIVVKSGIVQAVAAPPWNMWSGNQKSLQIWLSLRDELRVIIAGDATTQSKPRVDGELLNLFGQKRPLTGRFGFDSSAAWNAQDVGFSPNDQGMSVESSPATELLAAVGLQRFRPVIGDSVIQYYHWNIPSSPPVAAAFACGGIAGSGTGFQFEIVDRGQYSAFGKARPVKGDSING